MLHFTALALLVLAVLVLVFGLVIGLAVTRVVGSATGTRVRRQHDQRV